MHIAKRIPISSKLENEIKAAAGLPISEDNLEKVDLGEGIDAFRLKTDPSQKYRGLVDQIVSEIQAGNPDAEFLYRWRVVQLRYGRLASEDQDILILNGKPGQLISRLKCTYLRREL
ncbi:hypothetical protein DL763_007574 [Monosporascus cannonballus]|nr:hypothetical protein DL763_007574 [Monosporascus cannonballus]